MSDCNHEKICNICNTVNMLLRRYQMRNNEMVGNLLKMDEKIKELKQENEKLKRENLRYRDDFEIIAKENNTLKQKNEAYLNSSASTALLIHYQQANKGLSDENEKLKEENNKHIQVIMELKRNNDLSMDIAKKFLPPEEEPSNTAPSQEKQCKFKVGDRVCFTYYIDFRNAKRKGTVLEIEDDKLTIDHDGYISHLHFSRCKKMVRKPKFKVGDRVVYRNNLTGFKLRASVLGIENNGLLRVYSEDIYLERNISSSECKRLVKVKKVNCSNCNGKGQISYDFICWPKQVINCENCNGTGVVKEKC